MDEQPKSSPAKQKPKPKPEEEKLAMRPVQATQENFGMLLAAVLHIQHTLGEQLGGTENKNEQQHLAAMETIKILSKTNALVRYGSYLMVTLAAGMMYLLLEIHRLEVLIAGLRR